MPQDKTKTKGMLSGWARKFFRKRNTPVSPCLGLAVGPVYFYYSSMVIHGLMLVAQEQLAPDQAKSTPSCKMIFPTMGYTESLEVTPHHGNQWEKTSKTFPRLAWNSLLIQDSKFSQFCLFYPTFSKGQTQPPTGPAPENLLFEPPHTTPRVGM